MSFLSHRIQEISELKASLRAAEDSLKGKMSEFKELSFWKDIRQEIEKGSFSRILFDRKDAHISQHCASLDKDIRESKELVKSLRKSLYEKVSGDELMKGLLLFDDWEEGGEGDFVMKAGSANIHVRDNRTRYADMVLVNDLNQVLFSVRNRNDEFEPGKYCLPGGHIDKDEDEMDAAIRELEEETGIRVRKEDVSKCGDYFDNKSHISYFCCHCNESPIVLEGREQINWEWVSLDDISQKPLLANLEENLRNIVELPKSVLNRMEESAAKHYFGTLEMFMEKGILEDVSLFINSAGTRFWNQIEKGRAGQIGERRTWAGKQYQKTSAGWRLVKKESKEKSPEKGEQGSLFKDGEDKDSGLRKVAEGFASDGLPISIAWLDEKGKKRTVEKASIDDIVKAISGKGSVKNLVRKGSRDYFYDGEEMVEQKAAAERGGLSYMMFRSEDYSGKVYKYEYGDEGQPGSWFMMDEGASVPIEGEPEGVRPYQVKVKGGLKKKLFPEAAEK